MAYEEMATSGCRPDSGVYNAVAGTLWSTGVLAAQAKAVAVFQAAMRAGHFRLSVHTAPDAGASCLRAPQFLAIHCLAHLFYGAQVSITAHAAERRIAPCAPGTSASPRGRSAPHSRVVTVMTI